MSSVEETFRDEARELLAELEGSLLELEDNPEETDAVGRVFRALHTLKGAGAMAGFESVSAILHDIESVFAVVRAGELGVSRELVTLTLAVRDRIKAIIEGEEIGAGDGEEALREAIRSFLPALEESPHTSVRPDDHFSEEAVTYRIRFRPPLDIFQRGVNPSALLHELEQLGPCRVVAQVDAIPPLKDLDPELCYLYWDVILTTSESENAIRDVFIFVEDESELKIKQIDTGHHHPLPSDRSRLGEILVERGDLSHADLEKALFEKKKLGQVLMERKLVDGGKVDAALAEQERLREVRQQRLSREAEATIRVRSEKFDSLVDLVGELVTVQARLSRLAAEREDDDLATTAENVERLTWAMRDQVLNIRMLPIGSTFTRFRRMVRDLGEELDKDVELTTEGAETELDKTVIERLHEPLVHLIRNSIDHGIEPAAVRLSMGKPARGRVHLAASHSGGSVLIRIGDDGRGFDLEALKARAVAQGIMAADADLADTEIFELAFLPGLSTAGIVTSVSGRGVGMDVVRKTLEDLQGTIEAESLPGKGTTFTLKLPLTLAIIDGLLVQVGEDRFVMPLSSVEECIELTEEEESRGNGRNLVRVRGEIVPYIRLRETFRTDGEAPGIEQIAIARMEGGRFGFVVDRVVGEHQTVIKSLGKMVRDVKGFSGATVLDDGQVALILDLPQLLKSEESAAGRIRQAHVMGSNGRKT